MEFLVRYDYHDLEARAANRDAHVERLRELARTGRVLLAGPTTDGTGAVLVLRTDDEATARQLMDSDPYMLLGAVRDYSVEGFEVVVSGSSPG